MAERLSTKRLPSILRLPYQPVAIAPPVEDSFPIKTQSMTLTFEFCPMMAIAPPDVEA